MWLTEDSFDQKNKWNKITQYPAKCARRSWALRKRRLAGCMNQRAMLHKSSMWMYTSAATLLFHTFSFCCVFWCWCGAKCMWTQVRLLSTFGTHFSLNYILTYRSLFFRKFWIRLGGPTPHRIHFFQCCSFPVLHDGVCLASNGCVSSEIQCTKVHQLCNTASTCTECFSGRDKNFKVPLDV